MLILEFEIHGDEETRRSLEGIVRATRGDRLREPWERAVEFIASAVRDLVPEFQGVLKSSIDDQVVLEGTDITGMVYSDTLYAPFQERGADPYWPNIEALEDWADAHDTTAYVVARAIATRGLIPLKFAERALEQEENLVWDLIGDAIAQIIEAEY